VNVGPSLGRLQEMDAAQKLLLDGASMEDPGWEESSTLRPRMRNHLDFHGFWQKPPFYINPI